MNHRSGPRHSIRPTVERLEDRDVPAGNVTAMVFDGVLYIGGDEEANSVLVSGNTVSSLDGTTTINGQSGAQSFSGISKGLHALLRGGDDTIEVRGFSARHTINIYGEGGDDVIRIINSRAGKGSIIDGGEGNDQLYVSGSTFGKLLSFTAGAGDDYASVTGNGFTDNVLLNGGDGDDTFQNSGNSGAPVLTGSITAGDPPAKNTDNPDNGNTDTPQTDTTAPTVSLGTTAISPTTLASIPVTATFSENVTGMALSDVQVTNGTVSSFVAVSPNKYTFNVAPTEDGPVKITIPAAAAQDDAGNASTAITLTVNSVRTTTGMTTTLPDVNSSSWVAQGSAGLKVWNVQDVNYGGQAVSINSKITVYYTGWLTNGTVFDQNRTVGSPSTFTLTQLIAGWQQGLIGMTPGDIRRLYVPPELGYGSSANGNIPANSTLVFEIKLLAVS